MQKRVASGHQKKVTILFKLYRGMDTRQRQPICNVLVVDVYLMQCSGASFQFCMLNKSNLRCRKCQALTYRKYSVNELGWN